MRLFWCAKRDSDYRDDNDNDDNAAADKDGDDDDGDDDEGDVLEIPVEWEGKLQQVFCFRAGNDTQGFSLEKQRERWISEVYLAAALVGVAWEFVLELGAKIKQWVGGEKLVGKICDIQ